MSDLVEAKLHNHCDPVLECVLLCSIAIFVSAKGARGKGTAVWWRRM